jgi:large subunit ribosomal protein L31
MKEGIHPDYHPITVKLTDGSSFETSSTWGKKGDVLQLDIDVLTHNAWVGGKTKVNERAGNVAKFNQKFGGFNLASMSEKVGKSVEKPKAKKKDDKKDAKPAAAEAKPEDKKE